MNQSQAVPVTNPPEPFDESTKTFYRQLFERWGLKVETESIPSPEPYDALPDSRVILFYRSGLKITFAKSRRNF